MKKKRYKILPVLFFVAVFLLNSLSFSVSADELKVGSVKGLPEKLVVLDDNGQSVSENGEYFFSVVDMQQGEIYTKKIQIMNLREDAKYKITFRAQPIEHSGDFNLEDECRCDIYLDEGLIYTGKVTGEGTPDIRENAMSLGVYKPGESHTMKVQVVWLGTDAGGHIDEGARLVDYTGTTVLRDPSGDRHIEGEVKFRWIFYAEVTDAQGTVSTISSPSSQDSNPGSKPDVDSDASAHGGNGGNGDPGINDVIKTGETIAFVAIGAVMAATLLLIILAASKKKKKKKKSE